MKKRIIRYSLLTILVSISAKAVELENLVVKSDFRDSKLNQTTANITLIDSYKIEDREFENIENILTKAPNINYTTGASRAHFIQIRGIGERSQFLSPINPSVALIVDGIDLSYSALALTPFDLKQIEILRGPQGTKFGANGMGGVINLISHEPSKESSFKFSGTVGNYNKKTFGVAGGGEILKDKLFGRVSFYSNKSDGYMRNSYLKRDDTNNLDEKVFKTAFRYLLDDKTTIDLNYLHLDMDNGYDAFTLDNSRVSHADEPGFDKQKTDGFALKIKHDLNQKFRVEAKLSGSKTKSDYGYDEDWSYKGEFSDDLGPYSSKDRYIRDRKNYDIDIRAVSKKDGAIFDGMSDWVVGVYYKDFSEDLKREYTYLENRYKSSYDTTNKAIYSQIDTHMNKKLTLTTGLRVERWSSNFSDNENFKTDSDETLLGAKLGLNYQADSNRLYYITLTKGYKPGGINSNNSLPQNSRAFKKESLYNLDIGLNSSHLDGKLYNRLNLFYGKRRDQQVKSSIVKVRDDGSSEFIDYFTNAAKTHYYGLESELNYTPIDGLNLYSSLSLLKSEFDEYIDPNPKSINVNGRAPAQSPKYQYDIGFDYLLGEHIKLSSDIEGKGSYYFSNRHNAKANSYALLNSSITFYDGDWSMSLWGRNLTNKEYATRGFGSFGNNPAKAYKTEVYTQKGDPKTYGLTLSYQY